MAYPNYNINEYITGCKVKAQVRGKTNQTDKKQEIYAMLSWKRLWSLVQQLRLVGKELWF